MSSGFGLYQLQSLGKVVQFPHEVSHTYNRRLMIEWRLNEPGRERGLAQTQRSVLAIKTPLSCQVLKVDMTLNDEKSI